MIMRRCSSEPAASRRRPLSQGECSHARGTTTGGSRRCALSAAQTSPSFFGRTCADTDGPSAPGGTTLTAPRPWTASQQQQHCCSSELRRHYSSTLSCRSSATTMAAVVPDAGDAVVDTRPPRHVRRHSQTLERVEPGGGSAPEAQQEEEEMVVRGEALTTTPGSGPPALPVVVADEVRRETSSKTNRQQRSIFLRTHFDSFVGGIFFRYIYLSSYSYPS